MFKQKTSLAFGLILTLLNQLPHANLASGATIVPVKQKPSCLSCSAARDAHSSPDNLTTLGRRTQPLPLKPVQRSVFEGLRVNLVSTATGDLAFTVTDLELGGVMPILFQRVYDSDRRDEDTGLGAGWSFVFDDRIRIDGDSAMLTTGTGARLAFRRDRQSQRFTLGEDEPGAHQSFDLTSDGTISEQAAGLTRTYKKIGAAYHLTRIADPNSNSINLAFNSRGNVASITNGSATIALEWSDTKESRLLSVSDNAGRRVAFKQDGQRLRAVTDPAGAQWTYNYAADRLTEAADPLGRILLRALYDKAGRAVESGDAAGAYSFNYSSTDMVVSPRTVVTDPAGAKTVFAHTSKGALSEASDEEGRLALVEYNSSNYPMRAIDATGNESRFAYDAQKRLLRQTSSDGAEKTYVYDEQGHLISTTDGLERTDYLLDARGNTMSARSNDPAQSYDVVRDARGRTTSINSKAGRTVKLEYDAGGNETVIAYSDAGRFERSFDAAGHKVSERLPGGFITHYKYDARGNILEQSNDNGRSLQVERDASGAITGLVSGGGSFVRAERDAAGRIVALTNSSGKVRRFAYDARGSLVSYTDARGKHTNFSYDHRGRLRSVADSEGVSLRLDYDRAGKLLAVRSIAPAKDATQFLRASFSPISSFTRTLAQDEFCLFGGGDGWFDGDTFYSDFGMNCMDPFGELGDTFGGDGIFNADPNGCNDCKDRHKKMCDNEWRAKYVRTIGVDAVATAGCAVITVGVGAIFCAGAGLLVGSLEVVAINSEYDNCLLRIPDDCRLSCTTG
jgi:YD repeat-containing protein